jgi:hypothetical protein
LNDIHNGLMALPLEIKEKLAALEEFGDYKQVFIYTACSNQIRK